MSLTQFMRRAQGLSKRGFPFMLLRSKRTAMGQIRATARAELFAGYPRLQRWLMVLVMTLAWPWGALVDTVREMSRPPLRQQCLPVRLRRGLQMLAMSLLHNVPPLEFSAYRLNEPSRRARAGDYLYWPELNVLRTLNHRNGAHYRDVQDKARFADLCRTHYLPCIPTLAVFSKGTQQVPLLPYVPDQPNLWAKDLAGSQGSGAERWQLHAGVYQGRDGRALAPAALAEHWRQRRDCIVQPCLANHPDLASLANGNLLALRIVTGRHRLGHVHVITQLLPLPWGNPLECHPPILCGIDPATGRIIRALTANGMAVEHHPDSGARLVGTCLPYWQQCLELVVRAHAQAFERFVFLGWDVAIGADGPLLIETNPGWGCLHHQMIDEAPLGATAFAALALDHLENPPCV